MKCGANIGGVLETRAGKNLGNIIPNDKPIISFLLDYACCEYVNFISGIESGDKGLFTAYYADRYSTQTAIEKYRNMKYNKILYTTDISSAEDSLLDNYIVSVLRAGWNGRSIDSLYLFADDNADSLRRRVRSFQNGVLSDPLLLVDNFVENAIMGFYNEGERAYRSN